jgi:3-oxoacyl-[acyl-carrier protein] reductase
MDFNQKAVLVTGGTRGLGRAIALAFARRGARVAVSYHSDRSSAEAAESELQACGAECMVLTSDVSDPAQVEILCRSVIDRWAGVDILVNNAGITRDKLLLFLKEPDWDGVMATNLKGTYLCSRAVLKPMIARRFGRIINMTSPSAVTGRAGQTNYAASKAGIVGFTKSLAKEVARLGITVNAICPGLIDTPMTAAMDPKEKAELEAMIPMGRIGQPEEVAAAALFLASGHAAYITGQVITVDGGLT